MLMYWRELSVAWGESDPFGLVYYPRMLAWFNDTEHELFRALGFPTEKLIEEDRCAFVMGEVHFRFVGPAAYGERLKNIIVLTKVGNSTLHWQTKTINAESGITVNEGLATRIYARINEDGNLSSAKVPDDMRKALTDFHSLGHLSKKDMANMRDIPNPEAFVDEVE